MSRPDPRFTRYIGIDYSGAQTAESSLKGLRVYEAHGDVDPVEVQPPPNARRNWTAAAHSLAGMALERKSPPGQKRKWAIHFMK